MPPGGRADDDDDLAARIAAAPRHGLNAKALILQSLAEGAGQADDAAAQRVAARECALRARAEELAAVQAAGPDFLAALDVREVWSVQQGAGGPGCQQ